MTEKNNLEHIFKNAFDSFDVPPSQKVWKGIAQDREIKHRLGLTEESPESIFSRIMFGFRVNPSNQVWTGIKSVLIKKLLYRRLTYMGLGILVLASTYFISKYVIQEKMTNIKSKVSSVTTLTINNKLRHADTKIPNVISSHKKSGLQKDIKKVINHSTFYLSRSISNVINSDTQSQIDYNKFDLESINLRKLNPITSKIIILPPVVEINQSNEKNNSNLTHPLDKSLSKRKSGKENKYIKYTRKTDFNNEESSFKFGIMAGLDYGNYTLRGGSDVYKQVRRGQELFRPGSFHAGLTFSLKLNENWYIQLNAAFANLTMLADYEKKIVTPDTIRDNNGKIVKIDKKVILDLDTTTPYSFKTIEFPILLGYTFGIKRWSLHAITGPSYNIIIKSDGALLNNTNMNVENLNSASFNISKHQLGWWLSMGGAYQISHKYSLTIEPILRYNISNLFVNSAIKQHNYSTGLNFGLRYHFD